MKTFKKLSIFTLFVITTTAFATTSLIPSRIDSLEATIANSLENIKGYEVELQEERAFYIEKTCELFYVKLADGIETLPETHSLCLSKPVGKSQAPKTKLDRLKEQELKDLQNELR